MSSTESWKPFLPRRAVVMGRPMGMPTATATATATAAATALPTSAPLPDSQDSLSEIARSLEACTRCKLSSGRKTIVIGEGNPRARLVFVGEGPGEQEDVQGRPFVGKAGQLLDRMIEAMGLKRSDVFILNVVKCRPPGNRNPEPDEIESCGPFLYRQLDAIRPEVIVALGKFAAQTLLKTEERISSLRGRFHGIPRSGQISGAKLMPTFHPAYLLRNPASKREAWDDLKKVAQELGLEIPKKSPS
jgi:uracil-DNA glycosylase